MSADDIFDFAVSIAQDVVYPDRVEMCVHEFTRCGSMLGEVHLERCTKCKKVRPIEPRR
jgi:hypothetical protein